MTSNAISYIFEGTNETDDRLNMEIKKTLSSNLLRSDDLQDYSLSITRLAIPTSELAHLYFSDSDINKYSVSLKMFNSYLNTYKNYTKTLPTENSHGIVYNSKEKIIEMLNRALANCYRQYFEDPLANNLNMKPVIADKLTTFTNASNLGADIAITTTYNKFAGHKLRILSPVTKTLGSNSQIMRLFIQSHDGIKQYLYIGTIGDFINKSAKAPYDITEDSYRDWDYFDTNKGHTDVKAFESYVKFKDAVFTPKCNVGVESNDTFSITIQYQLSVYFSDEQIIPTQSPFISRVGQKLHLNFQNYYYRNNHQVGFSGFFNNSMDFTTLPKRIEGSGSSRIYFVQYDAMILATDLSELIVISQDTSTIEKLGNLSEIQLRSSALSSVSENIISNASVPISSSVLQEFVVFKDDPLGNQLLYSESNVPWRRIDMSKILHQTRNIDLSIYSSYENGSSKILQLNPGETWSVRLSFLRN